jgi:hypothetical protein
MSTKLDWMQSNHELLYNQGNLTVGYLTPPVLDRIGLAGASLVWYNSDFIPKHDLFNVAFEDWLNLAERTITKTAVLTVSEKNFIKVYRQLYNGYLKRNPLVSDADLLAMGLPKHPSGEKTPTTKPDSIIVASTDTSKPAIVSVNYRDINKKGTAKPKGVHGAELRWVILTAPPKDWAQLVNSVFDTRTPIELVFTGDQRGKTLYFAMRWENTVGEKGPWSEIYSVIIP